MLAIFDLDGTILDTLDDLMDATNRILVKFGFAPLSREQTKQNIGNGILTLIRRSVPANTKEDLIREMFDNFLADYIENCNVKTKAYAGVTEALTAMKQSGVKLAVVSNKIDAAVQLLVGEHFPGLFNYVSGERAGVPKKPEPDMILRAMKACGAGPEDTVYFGDGDTDVKGAVAAGLTCICVTWGFRTRQQLETAGGTIFIDTPDKFYSTTML